MRSRAKFTPRRTYGHQKSTYIRESQSAIRNGKQNPGTRMNTGFSAISHDKRREQKTTRKELVRMRSPVRIWIAAPGESLEIMRFLRIFFFITVSSLAPKVHTKGHTPSKYRILYRIEKARDLPPAFSFYLPLPAASRACRKMSPARLTLSSSAWVYILRVVDLSVWPSFSLTEATSAPLVMATLAKL